MTKGIFVHPKVMNATPHLTKKQLGQLGHGNKVLHKLPHLPPLKPDSRCVASPLRTSDDRCTGTLSATGKVRVTLLA